MGKRVFIIGAGYVGSAAAELLRLAGHSVSTGRRSPRLKGEFKMDVLNSETYPNELLEAEIVIYCVSADNYSDDAYRSAYVDGLRNIISFLRANPNKLVRFIFVSSTGVYAQSDGQEVTEQSETAPLNFSGKRLLEGEALLKELKVSSVALRFSGIYGPGRAPLVDEVRSARQFSSLRLATFSNRIHRDDCARMLHFISEAPAVSPVYIGSDLEPVLLGEVVNWLAEQLGVSIRITSDATELVRERGNKQCMSKLIVSEGFKFLYPSYKSGFGMH